ncbi:hypothetical protein [Burkholderia cepacia]|uniref:hypothetical protein n=1 Tax=Burkholderia cepacia TaxID=292 RepID=UPI00158E272F|nr:hypothetical protein [Burkholderia cepacia]
MEKENQNEDLDFFKSTLIKQNILEAKKEYNKHIKMCVFMSFLGIFGIYLTGDSFYSVFRTFIFNEIHLKLFLNELSIMIFNSTATGTFLGLSLKAYLDAMKIKDRLVDLKYRLF